MKFTFISCRTIFKLAKGFQSFHIVLEYMNLNFSKTVVIPPTGTPQEIPDYKSILLHQDTTTKKANAFLEISKISIVLHKSKTK